MEVPPGAFLQASGEAEGLMTRFVLPKRWDRQPVCLTCLPGLGTYSFPLSKHAQVMAIEGEVSMVKAMQEAALSHKLGKRFEAKQRDLFRNPRFRG